MEKFEVAQQSFFHWAVVSNPKSATALLNFALLHQCVLNDYDKAEKFYLRALAVAPTDQRIIENFEQMEKNRLPGGAYAGRGPSNIVLKRSEVVEERPEWGEWQRMFDRKSPDPSFKHFWYNKLARLTQFVEPNWKELCEIRAERSSITYENEADGWVRSEGSELVRCSARILFMQCRVVVLLCCCVVVLSCCCVVVLLCCSD